MKRLRSVLMMLSLLFTASCAPGVGDAHEGPLRLHEESAIVLSGRPVATLDVQLSRTIAGDVSIDATMTNQSDATFSSSGGEWLYVGVGSTALYARGRQAFGGPTLAPGETRTWHLALEAPDDGVLVITVRNWFVPLPPPAEDGAMAEGSFDLTASVSDIPRVD